DPVWTLVPERFIGVRPGLDCPEPVRLADLRNSYWRLTLLGESGIRRAQNQREAHLVFREDGRLTGVITTLDMVPADGPDPATATAAELARPHPPVLEAGDTLDAAMELMDQAGESHIAVVEDEATRRLVGFVHEHDVMLAYHRAILRARAEERGEAEPAVTARRLRRGRHRRTR
ncbi:MAG: CBS domain-containing protein, partial [Alphaproteobacteria bacterium]|nr:CBS domain-containing protein [Alphaproteobacteria bacterium]